MFCAAIPATLAVGVSTHGRQARSRRRIGGGAEIAESRLPVVPLTMAAVAALSVCAVVNHALLRGVMPL
jgi:hypothetical protein